MDIVERMQRDLDIGCSASIGDTKKAIAEIKQLREKLTKQNEDIEELKKTIETLEEEVYVRTSDLTHVFVGMNHKE